MSHFLLLVFDTPNSAKAIKLSYQFGTIKCTLLELIGEHFCISRA